MSQMESQQFAFQAEVQQLLHILAQSPDGHQELAVRELVSSAADALDTMQYVARLDRRWADAAPLEITIERHSEQHVLAVCDNGAGMTREELLRSLGLVTRSSSIEFLRRLSREHRADLSRLGQFGLGLYSVFLLAQRVQVFTRSYAEQTGWVWESDGKGTFRLSPAGELPRGTKVVLELKPGAHELTDTERLGQIVEKFGPFAGWPIKIDGRATVQPRALWAESPSGICEDDYVWFYRYLVHNDEEEPLWYVHLSADAPYQFHALVYCPPLNSELLGYGPQGHGMHLRVGGVLVDRECRRLVPEYLRFLRGVVNSEDLPLAGSDHSSQERHVFQTIRSTLVRNVLDHLEQLADRSAQTYLSFYQQFGRMLKEGAHIDMVHRPRLARLLRFLSSRNEDPRHPVTLDKYVARCARGQSQVYYLGGTDLASIRNNPLMEIFQQRDLEVLYLLDPIDEFVFSSLEQWEGKKLTSIDSAEVQLPEADAAGGPGDGQSGSAHATSTPEPPEGFARLLDHFAQVLGNHVQQVRVSERLLRRPCCLVRPQGAISAHMEQVLQMSGHPVATTKPILEVNPAAELIEQLCVLLERGAHDFVSRCAEQLLANLRLLEGVPPNRHEMVARVEQFMLQATQAMLNTGQ